MKKLWFYLAFVVAILLGPRALSATTISGTVNYSNATGVTGRLGFRLSQQGAQLSTGGCGGPAVIVPSAEIFVAVTGGVVTSSTILGNDCISPSNTYYIVRFLDGNGNVLFTQNWQVTGTTLNVGTILPVIVPQGTISVGTAYITSLFLSGLTASRCVETNSANLLISAAAACGTGGGGGGVSGLTTGYLPKAASATTLGNSLCDEGITTANTLTCTHSAGLAAPSYRTTATGAGYFQCTNGTLPTLVSGNAQIACPAGAITNYQFVLPTASATGLLFGTNSSNVNTLSFCATLTSNVLVKGSGAACPTNSLTTDDGTSSTYTGTGGTKSPAFTATGSTAGFADYPQGTTSASVAPCNTATSICEQAPASVTSYLVNKPGVAAQGIQTNRVTSAVVTQGFSGDSSHSAAVTTGSGTSIGSTSLCSTTECPVGTFQVNVYLDITTACGTSGTYSVSLVYTDDQGSKTWVLPIEGTGTAAGLLTTTSTANFGSKTVTIRSTGAASINYLTTAVACGTAGPMVGKLYLSVVPVQ